MSPGSSSARPAVALACAVAAILIWASLATLGVSLGSVPPLLLIGLSLSLGGLLSSPWARRWTLSWRSVLIGCYGMLAYHLLFVLALRHAPPVSANLVQYTWPALIVLLSPWMARRARIGLVHVSCAVVGFAGAGLAIVGGGQAAPFEFGWGYVFAIGAALVWSTYSLTLSRAGASSSANVGLACLVSGVVCLLLHTVMEPAVELSRSEVLGIVAMGIGPLGGAFYLWAYALKHGDPRVIGVLANATPLLSTALLALSGQGAVTASLLIAALLVSSASLVALVASRLTPHRRAVAGRAEKG